VRKLALVIGIFALAGLFVGGAVALRNDSPAANEPTITTSFGEEQAGLNGRMQEAEQAGPYSIRCSGDGAELVCTSVADDGVIPALKNGETVYGRYVIGFRGGANPERDEGQIVCAPVTEVAPTVEAGQDTFAYYKRLDVTFDENDTPVSWIGEATIPLTVVD
jgi:hypothetical protein